MNPNRLSFAWPGATCLFSLLICLSPTVVAQSAYQLPPQEVVDIIDAKPQPAVSFSPDTEWMMLIERDALPDIADVSRRMLQLAGLRIDPAANGQFSTSYYRGLRLKRTGTAGDGVAVNVPENAKISSVSWSHDSTHFAFTVVDDAGQQLYRGSVNQPQQVARVADNLNTVLGGVDWLPDGQSILCRLVPKNRGAEPAVQTTPEGPNIQESVGNTSPTRTYQDLLKNPSDERLFEYYTTTQLTIIDPEGQQRPIGQPAILSELQIAPSGDFLLQTSIEPPFSYLLTYRSFPRTVEVVKLDPTVAGPDRAVVAKIPMDENIPIEGVRMGPRNIEFRPGTAATLTWVEALDGGDPNVAAEHRDRVMAFAAPFDQEPSEMLRVQHRASGLSYFEDPNLVMTTEYDRDRRWIKSLLLDLSAPTATPRTMMDRSIRDSYGDPGRIVNRTDPSGYSVARQDGEWIYRTGSGASPQGNLPFVDRQNINTLETERLWRCESGQYESVVAISASGSDVAPQVITVQESKTTPPNYFMRNLDQDANPPLALTDFPDPTPQIRGIRKQLVKYQRADGVPLSATLYLPADYQEGTRLPLLVWAYPREFNDVKTAGQVSGSTDRFTQMRGITHLTLLTQGYAIMDSATMPVIGDPETMNDTFIQQIVDSAAAAIDKAVEMGVADRDRVAVGGHSYGAFMTANLLAHCDLFRAGVARSGAYNRTLTPFGFQSERRPYWQAKNIYHSISPFLHADKINEPLLLIHGENDNNSGTFPIQSKRMYQAIKGNGGTVRLCMLPYESHGYQARQSVLHTQAEMINWLNLHVKPVREKPSDPQP